jgi:hypothetical protein
MYRDEDYNVDEIRRLTQEFNMSAATDKIFAELDLDQQANLGLATTSNLLAELQARFEVAGNDLCAKGMQKTREWCTRDELEYKSVEDNTPSDLDIDPVADVFIYIFPGEHTFVTAHEPGESELLAIEDGELIVLKLDDEGDLSEVSENGTCTPLPMALAQTITGTQFVVITEETEDDD